MALFTNHASHKVEDCDQLIICDKVGNRDDRSKYSWPALVKPKDKSPVYLMSDPSSKWNTLCIDLYFKFIAFCMDNQLHGIKSSICVLNTVLKQLVGIWRWGWDTRKQPFVETPIYSFLCIGKRGYNRVVTKFGLNEWLLNSFFWKWGEVIVTSETVKLSMVSRNSFNTHGHHIHTYIHTHARTNTH